MVFVIGAPAGVNAPETGLVVPGWMLPPVSTVEGVAPELPVVA